MPTQKSNMEESFEKMSSRIVPGLKKKEEENEDGSARGTVSPFDDENDLRNMKTNEYKGEGNNGIDERNDDRVDVNDDARSNWFAKKQPFNVRGLERIANRIKPGIPDEDEIPIRESTGNTKDIGSPSNVYVNMSGEAHNYGDENKEEDTAIPNRYSRPDVADNENERRFGDYYPMEEENWSRPHDDNEDENEGYKKSLDEFDLKARKLEEISHEASKIKNLSPPMVVHPDGDPLKGDLKKAFYEFHPVRHLSQHLATISDFNVRSKINKGIVEKRISKLNRNRRSLIANKIFQRFLRF